MQCAPGRMQIHLTSLRGPWLGSLQLLLQMAIPWRCVTRPISLPHTWRTSMVSCLADVPYNAPA